jgi:hypothetical protein
MRATMAPPPATPVSSQQELSSPDFNISQLFVVPSSITFESLVSYSSIKEHPLSPNNNNVFEVGLDTGFAQWAASIGH